MSRLLTKEDRELVAKAKAILSSRKKAVQKDRRKPYQQKDPAEGFMSWQHDEGLSCIACLIEGRPSPEILHGQRNPIEVAHQKRNSADPTWQSNRVGKKVSAAQSCPLCWWHHQGAPNACDKGQAKFWDRLGVDVVAFTRALMSAFQDGRPGQPVVTEFAALGGSAALASAHHDSRGTAGAQTLPAPFSKRVTP